MIARWFVVGLQEPVLEKSRLIEGGDNSQTEKICYAG